MEKKAKKAWNKIADVPQNMIMQQIRDIVRRKTRTKFVMSYARWVGWWAELQMHSRSTTNRQMICSVSLMNGMLRYSFANGVVSSDVELPLFESPKFDPDTIAACLVAIYKRWCELQAFTRESFETLGDPIIRKSVTSRPN